MLEISMPPTRTLFVRQLNPNVPGQFSYEFGSVGRQHEPIRVIGVSRRGTYRRAGRDVTVKTHVVENLRARDDCSRNDCGADQLSGLWIVFNRHKARCF